MAIDQRVTATITRGDASAVVDASAAQKLADMAFFAAKAAYDETKQAEEMMNTWDSKLEEMKKDMADAMTFSEADKRYINNEDVLNSINLKSSNPVSSEAIYASIGGSDDKGKYMTSLDLDKDGDLCLKVHYIN